MRRFLLAAVLLTATASGAQVARAAPETFQVALTADTISGNPAGLAGITLPHTFDMLFTLDGSVLKPNLIDIPIGNGLISLSLTMGTRVFTQADFPSFAFKAFTDPDGDLVALSFGSASNAGNILS